MSLHKTLNTYTDRNEVLDLGFPCTLVDENSHYPLLAIEHL